MKKLIIYTTGGLCNQLRPISTAVRLAQILERELWIFQEPNFRCPINFNELFINRHNFIYADDMLKIENAVICASEWDIKQEEVLFGKTILRVLTTNGKNRICNVGCDAVDNTIQDENLILFSSYFFRQVEMIEAEKYLKGLQPNKTIEDSIKSLSEKHKIDKNVIGFHARGSDMNITMRDYDRKIQDLKDNRKIFICSDDKGYEQYFCDRYGKRMIRIEKQNYSYKINKKKESWSDNTTMTREAVIEGVIDLFLLAKTDIKIYCDRSSFAHVALLMGK